MSRFFWTDTDIADGANINPDKMGLKERIYDLALESCRKANGAPAPQTAADPDLALVGGTFATDSLKLVSDDVMGLGAVNRYTHFELVVPEHYNAGSPFTVRVIGGHVNNGDDTGTADTSSIVTLEAYLKSDLGGKTGSNLVTNPASRDINALTAQMIDFAISPVSLSPGVRLTCRLGMTINDGAGASAVKGFVSRIRRILFTRG